jgi:hypothetical protein
VLYAVARQGLADYRGGVENPHRGIHREMDLVFVAQQPWVSCVPVTVTSPSKKSMVEVCHRSASAHTNSTVLMSASRRRLRD